MSVTDKKIERVEHRREFIDQLAESVLPVLAEVHRKDDLSERFWRRILQPYFWAIAKRREEYKATKCLVRATVLPIDGFYLPSRIQSFTAFARQIMIALERKSLRRHLSSVGNSEASVSLGRSATSESDELQSVPLEIDFSKCFLRRRGTRRADIRAAADRESDPIVKNALRYLPEVYVEYFESFLVLCRQIANEFDPTTVYVEHFPTIFDLFLASYLGERGATIVQLQLGAGAGEVVYPGDSLSQVYYDKRLTYGWRLNDNDVPYYGVRLELFKRQYDAVKRQGCANDALLVYNRLSSRERKAYYEHCNRLIGENLDRNRYPKLVARPRRFSRKIWMPGGCEIPGIDAVSGVEVSSGYGPIADLCRISRIVVHWSHPATNFLECVFVDQPVVAVSPGLEVTEIFKPFFEFLVEARVLHAKPEHLIEHLNRIEPETWWRGVMNDARYEQFKERFARSRVQYQREAREGRHS